MTHGTCRLTAKNRDQLRNPMLGNRVWATFNFFIQQSWSRGHRCLHCPFEAVSAKMLLTFCGLCVRHITMNCAKTDEPIKMPFGVSTQMGPRISPRKATIFGGKEVTLAMQPLVKILWSLPWLNDRSPFTQQN